MTLTDERTARTAPGPAGRPRRRRKRAAAEPSAAETAELTRRPRLAPRVQVHEPTADGSLWIVQSGQQYIRVGADMAKLMRSMDGERDHAALVSTLGGPWTEHAVATAVHKLQEMRLLEDGRIHRHSGTWFKYVPPLTLQFTVLKPQRLLNRLVPLIRLLANRVVAVVAGILVLGGLLALTVQAPALSQALGQPLPFAVLLGVMTATIVTTALHEMGHGAVLAHYGGRPSRMGVMLFYMSPAFFCDVSDGWRLPHKEQRTRVALAGIVTQTVVAGTVSLAALVLSTVNGPSPLHDGMLIFGVSTYLTGVLNFVPLVKLDGYLALMSHLDIPHLRDRSMTDARRFLARILFGGRYSRELPQLTWAVPFGFACMLFPLYLVAVAIGLWSDVVQSLGLVGAAVMAAAISYLMYHAWNGGERLLREARRAGAGRLRIAFASVLAVAAVAAALVFVRLPYSVVGGFVQEGGQVRLVLADTADTDAVARGSQVRLERRGLVIGTDVGTGVVAVDRATRGTAPLSAFVPFREGDHFPMEVSGFALRTDKAPAERAGLAYVDAGSRPAWEWLYLKYVSPYGR
ncbi:daptide biosynthesis intramembrane metalloprotease [Streptomyces sp. NBC_00306]|uniref:daptide biosynthesis intramembrane metalloprotease n=1 Tax=Streptomyces sp. NBC_00306 TaxID=2975708 RepID=UPI002E2D9BEA|nr:daptide biosynthesis intramembrane metalloprotease [Streptomyces sp. NBC_00306]